MPDPAPDPIELDHVAIALRDVGDTLATLVGDFGASVVSGGANVGFRVVQVRMGMTVELIEPWKVERFDFLARFLDRNGEGPHHLTFKVDGITEVIERLSAAGYTPVSQNLDNPWWREAFLHPKATFGTVVQVAEAKFDARLLQPGQSEEDGDWHPEGWWPPPPPQAGDGAELRRVMLRVPEMDGPLALFGGLLGGSHQGDGELVWPGGGRLRLEVHDGPPGIDRLECEWVTRGRAPEEREVGGARFVLGSRDGSQPRRRRRATTKE